MFTEVVGESYREYFVRRKAPWLYGGWEVAICGDKKPQEIPGKGGPPGYTLNDNMGKPTPRSPRGGHLYPSPHAVVVISEGSLWGLQQVWSLSSFLPSFLRRSWNTELNLDWTRKAAPSSPHPGPVPASQHPTAFRLCGWHLLGLATALVRDPRLG